MGLTDEQIEALLSKTRKPRGSSSKPPTGVAFTQRKLIRRATQYPQPAAGSGITYVDSFPTLRCVSRGCGSPAGYRFKGIPYCNAHLITLISHELVNKGDDTNLETTSNSDIGDFFAGAA